MKIRPHSVESRLQKWGQWVQEARHVEVRSSSPFGRIADERNAAGNHGEGIRYEIIEGTPCPPDGGLSREYEAKAAAWGYDIRCREVHAAVSELPDDLRRVMIETYIVPPREEPRSAEHVASRVAHLNRKAVSRLRIEAHDRVAQKIYGPFEVVADGGEGMEGNASLTGGYAAQERNRDE
ncbi:MAG: hypothetical protein ACPHN2_08740 [Sinimarinibacterium flocculans]|uniref:hypothetical protein n=1 Tax=Sinimarinibacterium flocculans TaxID=985250 RepID=UPI003C68462F